MPSYEIHTTDRQTFKKCRQRWEFSSNLRMNLEPTFPIEALWFGIGLHKAWASYYDPTKFPRDINRALLTLATYISDWWRSLDIDSQDEERLQWSWEMWALGEGMLKQYGLWAPQEDAMFKVIWVEKEFHIPIPGLPGVTYSFRVDGLVQDELDRLWILEHKTTAQFAENTDYLLTDDQCGSYLWGIQEALGIQVEGIIYNEAKKKAPKQLEWLEKSKRFSMNKQQDTTFDVAANQLLTRYGQIPPGYDEYLEFLKTKPNNFNRRIPVRRNQREIKLLGESLRYEILDMLNNPSIYRSASRINCNGCPFLSPCIVKWEGGDVDFVLNNMYKERTVV